MPATPITSELEAELPGEILGVAQARPVEHALKLSAAFGGANAALVLSAHESARPARKAREVYVSRGAHVGAVPAAAELATKLGVVVEKLVRTDGLVRACLAACGALTELVGPLDRETGVVVGHAATIRTLLGAPGSSCHVIRNPC